MFKPNQTMPLAGKYVMFNICCKNCEWGKTVKYEKKVGLINSVFLKVKREILKKTYKRCPECGGDVRIEEKFVIS